MPYAPMCCHVTAEAEAESSGDEGKHRELNPGAVDEEKDNVRGPGSVKTVLWLH